MEGTNTLPLLELDGDIIDYNFCTSYIFENYEEFCQKTSESSRGLCSKALGVNEFTFKCYDCELFNENQIYCADCFLNGNHENHRCFTLFAGGGCCDCGDSNVLKPTGHCKNHNGFGDMEKELFSSLKIEEQKKFEKIISYIFMKGFKLCEKMVIISEKLEKLVEEGQIIEDIQFEGIIFDFENENNFDTVVKESDINMLAFINKSLSIKMNSHFVNVLNILNQLIENNCLNFFISFLLTKNDLIKEFEFLHDCSDFQSNKIGKLLHSCQCSINQLLFRFNILMTEDIQNNFFQLFLRFFVSNKYKLTLISDLGNYIKYLVHVKKNNNNNEIEINYSYFLEIFHQIFQGEQGDAFCCDNYREGILYFIKIFYNLWDTNNDLMGKFIQHLYRFLDLSITKNLYSNNEKNQNFFIQILYLLCKFDLQEIKEYSLYLSIQIYPIIGRIFNFANNLNKGEKRQFAFNLFNLIIPELKTLQETYPKIRKPFITPILSYLISFVNIESINFLDLGILNDELENLAKILFLIFFSEFSFKNFKNKFLDRNIIINQFISSISHEELEFYKLSEISIPDHEINIIQFCYQYLSYENCLQNIFKFYSLDTIFNNLIDLIQDSTNTNTNEIILINIFLESFIITIIDTVHKVNTNRFIKPKTEYILNLIEENMIQLFVIKHFYSSYEFFNYAEHIFNSESDYRDCIGKNIIIDKAKNIKPKNNDDIYFQPFSWIRFPQIYSRLIEVLKDKKNSELDLILSNKITSSILKIKFAKEFKFFSYLILGLIKIDEKKLKIELFINILKLIEIGVEGSWNIEENNNINIILLTEFYNSEILKSYLKIMKETEEKETFLKIEKKIRELKKKILSSKSRSGDQIGEIGSIEDEKKRKWKEKQRELLAQFANKQTDFTTKFSEKIQIEDPKLENLDNKIICIDCHDSEIKENDYFVYPCLITRDNLEEYFYGANQCDQKNMKKKKINNGGFWISSCLHLLHHSCFIKQIKKNSNQCSFCKTPINFFTPFYEEKNNFFITQKNDIINYKELSNLIEELSFNKYELPKEEENIYFQFDNCIDHLIIINENHLYESDKENLVELFRKCIVSMIEYNFITTLDSFIKNIPILKNFINLLKFTFQKFCDEQFYMKLKEDLIKNCYEIFFSFIQNQENNLDRFFIDILISIFLLNNDKDKNQDMLLGFSKMFIYHLALIYSNNDQINKNLQNIDCIVYFFDSLKSKDFESKLFFFLNPYYKLIAIIFVLLYDIYDFDLEKKIDWSNEEEDINLFKSILNNKKLSENYFFDFSNISKIYDCQLVLSKLNIPQFLLKNPFNKFNIIPIGDTYFEMRNKFFLKKCSKCNYYSENSLVFILCLICGKRMCHQFCTSEKYRNKIKLKEEKKINWNILQHNKTKHCSNGVFLDINSGQLFSSDRKNIALIDCLYKDQFGESIKTFEDNNVYNLWNSYRIDEEQYRKIIDCLIMRKIEQKTHYVLIKN